MAVTQKQYDAGTAAALALIRHEVAVEVMPRVPEFFKGMIPIDKEPEAAAMIAKVVLEAADKAT